MLLKFLPLFASEEFILLCYLKCKPIPWMKRKQREREKRKKKIKPWLGRLASARLVFVCGVADFDMSASVLGKIVAPRKGLATITALKRLFMCV